MSLAELFPEGDHRFHLTLRRCEPREFFAPRDASGELLAERARWLATDPQGYAGALSPAEPMLREFGKCARQWGVEMKGEGDGQFETVDGMIVKWGAAFEPDLLFLSADANRAFRLQAGALCFPTGWALREKLGQTLESIHGIVPGLNPALGVSIQQFLSKLKPDVAYLRDNWGIAASEERNLHPARGISAPQLPAVLDRLWLRVERQALVALPQSGGVLFGIRIELHRLDTLANTPAGAGLRRALATMPAELATYKRLDAIRPQIVGML
jgi:dimethylamine monooxygenase subunit A